LLEGPVQVFLVGIDENVGPGEVNEAAKHGRVEVCDEDGVYIVRRITHFAQILLE